MNAIYMTNTTETTVPVNSQIPLQVNKRAGGQRAFMFLNGSVITRVPGYYFVTATVTFTAAEAGDINIVVKNNGVNVPGISATETITTADTEVRTVTLQGMVKNCCGAGPDTLELFNNNNIQITVQNASFTVIG